MADPGYQRSRRADACQRVDEIARSVRADVDRDLPRAHDAKRTRPPEAPGDAGPCSVPGDREEVGRTGGRGDSEEGAEFRDAKLTTGA